MAWFVFFFHQCPFGPVCVHMHVGECLGVCRYTGMCRHVCTCVWRAEDNLGHWVRSATHLVFFAKHSLSSLWPGVCLVSSAGCPGSPRDLPVPTFLAGGLKRNSTMRRRSHQPFMSFFFIIWKTKENQSLTEK